MTLQHVDSKIFLENYRCSGGNLNKNIILLTLFDTSTSRDNEQRSKASPTCRLAFWDRFIWQVFLWKSSRWETAVHNNWRGSFTWANACSTFKFICLDTKTDPSTRDFLWRTVTLSSESVNGKQNQGAAPRNKLEKNLIHHKKMFQNQTKTLSTLFKRK